MATTKQGRKTTRLTPANSRGIEPVGRWWALLHHPKDLPVVFSRKREALENRTDGEYLVRIWMMPVHLKDRSDLIAARAKRRAGAR